MKKHILLFLISINFLVHANPINNEPLKEIVLVSLGSHCQVALILRTLGLRLHAMPLDWVLSFDHKGLVRLIDNHFQQMFNEEYLIQYPEGYVINNLYNLDFRHDWTELDLLGQLPDIASKYSRRIERFFHLPEIAKRVVFVRTVFDPRINTLNNMPTYTSACTIIDAEQAQELHSCLQNKFPDLRFILAVINFTHTASGITSDMHGIVEFKVETLVEDYKQFLYHLGDPNFFDEVYKENGVKTVHSSS